MDSNGSGKNNSRLTPIERKDVASAATYADGHVKDMEDLIKKFVEMGGFGLFWDGKVPEKYKSIFNFISFKSSDKGAVLDYTKKYLDFFEALLTGMKKLNGDEEMSESERSDPLSIVDHLKGLLCDMDKATRSDLESTESSALYRKHSEFIQNFSQLDSMVNRVECIFSREKIRNLTETLGECKKTLLEFQSGMKDMKGIKKGMEEQIAELVTENERQRQHQQSLVALNAKLRDDQQNLLEKHNADRKRLKNIESLLMKLTQKEEL